MDNKEEIWSFIALVGCASAASVNDLAQRQALMEAQHKNNLRKK